MNSFSRMVLTNPLINKDGTITPRPCMNKHFAMVYGVDRRTFIKWLKPFKEAVGERVTNFYTQAQVQTIFEKLGTPSSISQGVDVPICKCANEVI
jgi:hypothetical protein